MSYNKYVRLSPNFTPASQVKSVWGVPRTIEAIAIHWWGDPNTKPSLAGVVNVLCTPSRRASAHYVASGTGRQVAQLVEEKNASWATNKANPFTISIECDPRCRNEDYDVVAELIVDIWKRHGKLPLVPHNKYSATQCPGNYSLSRLKTLAEKKIAPAPKPVPKIVYKVLPKPIKYLTNKAPTTLWDFSGSKWTDMKKVKDFPKGTQIDVYGTATHPLGSVYLMTKYSFDKKNNNGFNQVDMLKYATPIPVPPVEIPKVPPVPEPPALDPTDPDTVAGGDRIGELEKQIGDIRAFFVSLMLLVSNLINKLRG